MGKIWKGNRKKKKKRGCGEGGRGEEAGIKMSCRIEVVVMKVEEYENEAKKTGRKGVW